GKQVVLTQAVERDVADGHRLVALMRIKGAACQHVDVDAVTVSQVHERPRDPARRGLEALAVGILAQRDQDAARRFLELVEARPAGGLRQAHSALTSAALFSDSTTRTLRRRAGFRWGSSWRNAAMATFSAVGTVPRRNSTSRFRCR